MNNKIATLCLLLGAFLLLTGCDQLQQAFIDRQVKKVNENNFFEDVGDGIKVVLCGTGTPQIRSTRGQACTLVAAGGKLFMFDAGENALRNIETNGVPLPAISRVFITHWHSDHFNGLGGLINHTWVNGRSDPFIVYGPRGADRVVKGLAMAYRMDVDFRNQHFVANPERAFAEARTISLSADQNSTRVYDEGGVTIDAHRVNHYPVDPAFGYLLRYQGKKIFISGDTHVTDLYLEAMQDADLVIHEAVNSAMIHRAADAMRRQGRDTQAEHALNVIKYHSDTLELADLAEKAGVKHLVLTHLIPSPPNFIAKRLFLGGMSERFKGQITLGEDAMEIGL